MALRGGVRVDGLDDLQRGLSGARADLDRELEQASRDVAELVAKEGRGRASSRGGVAAHVAPSVQADGTSVSAGGSSYPMAAGAEFGGRGRPTTQQFQPYTSEGYFLYPAIRETEDQADALYIDHIDDLTRRHDLT